VHESQGAVSNQKWPLQLFTLKQFRLASREYKKFRNPRLQESMDIMENASEKFSAVKEEAGESVSTKLQAVLK
jgi:nucleoid DNA-binding protein